MPGGNSTVNSTSSRAPREPNTRLIVRGSPIVKVTAGVSGARLALGLRTDKPVKMTVSIVSPKAPMKVNPTTRCASVGFGRCVGAAGAGDFGSVGGAVTVVRLPFSRDHAWRDHTRARAVLERAGRNQPAAAVSQVA